MSASSATTATPPMVHRRLFVDDVPQSCARCARVSYVVERFLEARLLVPHDDDGNNELRTAINVASDTSLALILREIIQSRATSPELPSAAELMRNDVDVAIKTAPPAESSTIVDEQHVPPRPPEN
jgi:hypothetical protein